MRSNEELAIKLEPLRSRPRTRLYLRGLNLSRHPQLLYEAKIYKRLAGLGHFSEPRTLAGCVGIPAIHWRG